MRCETRHGAYRCTEHAGHDGDCQSPDMSGIPFATGRRLDEIGAAFGLKREGTTDGVFRARIWARATA